MESRNVNPVLLLSLLLTALLATPAFAETKIIEAENTYRMGDQDSRIDARRIAVQEAKRTALEQAGTYLESLTEVKSFQLTRDEIKTYAAGIVEAEVVSERMQGTPERPEISVKVRCTVDTGVLADQIGRVRQNEDLREQLDAAARENDALRKDRDALVRQLGAEHDKTKAEKIRQKLDGVLSREESNDETKRIWIAMGSPSGIAAEGKRAGGRVDPEKALSALQNAAAANPQNLRTRVLLASLYREKGESGPAEKELRQAIEHHPSSPLPHLMLGILLREANRPQEALRELHFVERMRPRNPVMLFQTGMTLKQMGRCGPAVRYLNKFQKTPPSDLYSAYRDAAAAAVEECGGDRPGRRRHLRQD